MANDPFTIRIFVPDGDPEGIRTIDRMNWTGLGIVFPREKWNEAKQRREFDNAGVYILIGYSESDDDLPILYIGEGDGIRDRIDSHSANKDFWTWGVAFVSTNRGLNKAHVQWLEYALVKRAKEVRQCKLENGNSPQEPALTESEKADTRGFLREICQILPLVGLRAFETPKAVVAPKTKSSSTSASAPGAASAEPDTIIVPAQIDGFKDVFLGENCWYAIRISGGMLPKIRWIAAYQTQPISAITHIAPVDHIEPYGDGQKYKVVFSEQAKPIGPIEFGDAPRGFMQGPRYTTHARLVKAKKLTDLFSGKG
jgi:hypothetical protein